MSGYTIERADTRAKYEGLRDLWHRVFGDEPGFTDHVYRTFGALASEGGNITYDSRDISGYVAVNDAGKVVSSLTCYRCGELRIPDPLLQDEEYAGMNGRPVYVTYAVCTDPGYRGQGLAGKLTEHVRSVVTGELGGISVVSPAGESLIAFYRDLGYDETCFISASFSGCDEDAEYDEMPDAGSPVYSIDVMRVDATVYNEYREEFLKDIPHVAMSGPMMKLVRSVSADGDGMLVINGGDAVCVLTPAEDTGEKPDEAQVAAGRHMLNADELIVAPRLRELSEEIDEEIASMLAGHFDLPYIRFRRPAYMTDPVDAPVRTQAMSSGEGSREFYFGFPLE